jgi:hypothetical protein
MSPEQFSELVTTLSHMRDTCDALSRTCQMLAASETDAGRHAFFHRMHAVLNDAKFALNHTLDSAPAMAVPQ